MDCPNRAGAGDVVEEEVPLVLGEVLAVFHPVALAGDGGEPRLGETSMAQGRPLEAHSVGGGLEGVHVEGARGVERVGAGDEFRGVGEAARPFPTLTIPLLRLGRR